MQTKRLLVITQAVDPDDSALGFFCAWLSEMAKDARVGSVEVWCLREGHWPEKPPNVTVRVFPATHRLRSFLGRLVADRHDAVFVHMSPIWLALGGWWWRLTGRRPVLWYTHGSASRTLRVAVWFADAVLTATPDAFPIASRKVRAIGHGIHPSFAAAVRAPRDGTGEALRVLAVGRISARKRVMETLATFEGISRRRPGSRLTWVGEALTDLDRAYAEEVAREVERRGLGADVSFPGARASSEMPGVYADADLLLHLSATGSLDKVVLEACASGCPVFSTNPATREAVPSAFWDGPLDGSAIDEAIARADRGMTHAERDDIARRFALPSLVSHIMDACFPI